MRRFLPREHGLWSWVGVPLAAALGLAPDLRTLAGAACVAVAFFLVNALRVRWPRTPWFEVPGILGLGAVGAGLARDARRVGMGELAWAVGAAELATAA